MPRPRADVEQIVRFDDGTQLAVTELAAVVVDDAWLGSFALAERRCKLDGNGPSGQLEQQSMVNHVATVRIDKRQQEVVSRSWSAREESLQAVLPPPALARKSRHCAALPNTPESAEVATRSVAASARLSPALPVSAARSNGLFFAVLAFFFSSRFSAVISATTRRIRSSSAKSRAVCASG